LFFLMKTGGEDGDIKAEIEHLRSGLASSDPNLAQSVSIESDQYQLTVRDLQLHVSRSRAGVYSCFQGEEPGNPIFVHEGGSGRMPAYMPPYVPSVGYLGSR
jgi:hypothetical protein